MQDLRRQILHGFCHGLHRFVRAWFQVASSPCFLRGGPISAGWKSTAAQSVLTSDIASSLPMLDVPGWFDSHRLPKAVAVVIALKKTARVRLDCKRFVVPAAPGHHEIDLERHAEAEQQRQRDDIGEVERHGSRHREFQRHEPGEQQRNERQQNVGHAAQDEEQQRR